jgi:glyoxylase-like metal-dependent hydrolase (beta-lactamase superfamily II)
LKYAGYPAPPLFDRPADGGPKPKPVQQLLWGDWLKPTGPTAPGWMEVHARGQTGWLPDRDVQDERLLEIAIIDVGQGDGALITTPKDRQILVDAGERDNMLRYLRWRFNDFRSTLNFEHAVITHPDLDHFGASGTSSSATPSPSARCTTTAPWSGAGPARRLWGPPRSSTGAAT